MIACCGKYLEESGIGDVLVENEMFGPGVIKSVMDGGHYVRSKRGMSIILEAMEHLQMLAFANYQDDHGGYEKFLLELENIQALFREVPLNQKKRVDSWNSVIENSIGFEKKFEDFRKSGCEKVNLFNIGTNLSMKYHLYFVTSQNHFEMATGICTCQHCGVRYPCALLSTELIINGGCQCTTRTV